MTFILSYYMYIDLSSDYYATDNQSKVEIHNIQIVIYRPDVKQCQRIAFHKR